MDPNSGDGLDTVTDADPRRPAQDLPVLDLGELAPDSPATTPTAGLRLRTRWWAVLLAFAVGAVAGAYAWNIQFESAAEADAARRADLHAADVLGSVGVTSETQHLRAPILNYGPREIEVLDVRPSGWSGTSVGPTVIPIDEWAVIRMAVEPDCSRPVPDDLTVEVRTAVGQHEVVLPLPPDGTILGAIYHQICGTGARYGLTPGQVTVLNRGAHGLTMGVDLRSVPPDVDFHIADLAVATGGFVAEGVNLPVAFDATQRSPSQLQIHWQITACHQTELLGDITIQVQIEPPEAAGYPVQVTLPGQAVAVLARHAADHCAMSPGLGAPSGHDDPPPLGRHARSAVR